MFFLFVFAALKHNLCSNLLIIILAMEGLLNGVDYSNTS